MPLANQFRVIKSTNYQLRKIVLPIGKFGELKKVELIGHLGPYRTFTKRSIRPTWRAQCSRRKRGRRFRAVSFFFLR